MELNLPLNTIKNKETTNKIEHYYECPRDFPKKKKSKYASACVQIQSPCEK